MYTVIESSMFDTLYQALKGYIGVIIPICIVLFAILFGVSIIPKLFARFSISGTVWNNITGFDPSESDEYVWHDEKGMYVHIDSITEQEYDEMYEDYSGIYDENGKRIGDREYTSYDEYKDHMW